MSRTQRAPTMAATAISLHLKTARSLIKSPFLRRFSASAPQQDPNSDPQTPNYPDQSHQSSFSSHFSDVKSSLRQPPSPPPQQQQGRYGRRFAPQQQQPMAPLRDDLLKNLSEFRLRSAAPKTDGDTAPPANRISFQTRELSSQEYF